MPSVTQSELEPDMNSEIITNLNKIVGREVVEAKIDEGAFITLSFNHKEGEDKVLDWRLNIQYVLWRLESTTTVLLTNENVVDERALKMFFDLCGKRVEYVSCEGICHDFIIRFDNQRLIKVFAYADMTSERQYESWELFTSEGLAFIVGPGSKVDVSHRSKERLQRVTAVPQE